MGLQAQVSGGQTDCQGLEWGDGLVLGLEGLPGPGKGGCLS